MILEILPETEVVQIEGVWTVLHQGRAYFRFPDAHTREEAESILSEMWFVTRGAGHRKPASVNRVSNQ